MLFFSLIITSVCRDARHGAYKAKNSGVRIVNYDKRNSITPIKGERLTDIKPKLQWTDIDWKKVEKDVNRLQTRITKTVKPNCCPIQKGL